MTRPASPHEPPVSGAAPPVLAQVPVPMAPQPTLESPAHAGVSTADLPAPRGVPLVVSTGPAMTATGKFVKVRPWRSSTAAIAVAAQALFAVGALVNLYLTWYDVRIKGLLDDQDFEGVVRDAETADGLYVPILLIGGTATIVLLVWLHRVWTSDRSDHSLYTRGTGMAIGGWFIPFANIALGPLALRDLLWGTEHASPLARPGRPVATSRLVVALRFVLGASVVLGMLGRSAQAGVDESAPLDTLVDSLQTALTYEAVGSVAAAVAALLLILTIRKVMTYTRR